ncbi:unnamed protein product [Durusdinium trenchii]|uniref:Uncharacterized protein n=2 Tax=Durusdinium trenchii TaxID=1381693 RepID=A0ABP0R0R3_9DINO
MGRVRSYEPTPVTPPANVQLTDFTFKLIQVELGDASKSNFNEKYKVKIPVHIRSRYSDDVVFGSEWRELLNDFDKKFSTKFSGPLTPVPTPKETVPEKPAWVGEPGTVQELINKFNIEVKLSGRTPGTTLYVVGSRDRSGKQENVEDRQEFKLYMGAHMPVEIEPNDFILAHGASRFLKVEKYQDLKRKGNTGAFSCLLM